MMLTIVTRIQMREWVGDSDAIAISTLDPGVALCAWKPYGIAAVRG
jgi:hypothetical protein